jgi:NhaA family Na+:H+ antiporter
METQCELVESPLHRIEHFLHPWISFLVMPLFAFANAGVRILGNGLASASHRVSLGVMLGLFIGKPLGIWVFAWMSAKTGLATPPAELSWGKILGAGCLSGIGFTMSLFIAALAFGDGALLGMAKIGTMAASVAAGICGSVILLRRTRSSLSESPEHALAS